MGGRRDVGDAGPAGRIGQIGEVHRTTRTGRTEQAMSKHHSEIDDILGIAQKEEKLEHAAVIEAAAAAIEAATEDFVDPLFDDLDFVDPLFDDL